MNINSKSSGVVLFLACLSLTALPAQAARKDKPAGQEISEKAKAVKLDPANAATAERGGKKIKVTPVDLSHVKTEADLEDGQVVGVLETEVAGDETGLPPGKYHIFVAKVGDVWHAYAESGGTIAAEAKRVRVERTKEKPTKKADIRLQGWCTELCDTQLYFFGGPIAFWACWFLCW